MHFNRNFYDKSVKKIYRLKEINLSYSIIKNNLINKKIFYLYCNCFLNLMNKTAFLHEMILRIVNYNLTIFYLSGVAYTTHKNKITFY